MELKLIFEEIKYYLSLKKNIKIDINIKMNFSKLKFTI